MKTAISTILITLLIATVVHAQDAPQWQLPEGAKMRLGKGSIYDMTYSPDGTKFAVATGIGIWIYDAHTWEEINLLSNENTRILNVAYSPDGKFLVSDIDENSLCIWDAETGRQLHKFYEQNIAYITAITFNPDGKTFASGDSWGGVQVWDVETRQLLHTYKIHTNTVMSLDYSTDGNLLASSSIDKTVQLYDPRTGEHLRNLSGHSNGVRSIAFSPDGKTIASASYDRTVRLWDVEAAMAQQVGANIQRDIIRNHDSSVYALAYSPDGTYLATASRDMTTRLWDVSTLNLQRIINNDPTYMTLLAFSPDSRTLISDGIDGQLHVWDVLTGSKQHIISGHNYLAMRSIAFSPDENTFVTNDVRWSLTLWDLNAGTRLQNFTGHTELIRSVAFSPTNNNLFASGGEDGTLRLWDADTGTQRTLLISVEGEVVAVDFSPDGNTVACAITYGDDSKEIFMRDSTIRQFDVATGTQRKAIYAHIAPHSEEDRLEFHTRRHVRPVNSFRYNHDGKMLITYNADGTIRFWDAETGQHLRYLRKQLGQIQAHSIAATSDGKILAAGTDFDIDGKDLDIMELWDITDEMPKRLVSEHVENVYGVVLNPNGTTFASLSFYGILHLWDLKTGRILSTFRDGFSAPAFSPSGNTLASGSAWGGTIFIWDITVRLPSDTAVSLSPDTHKSPLKGGQLTLSLNISNGQNVAGYQATLNYDTTALRYVESANGDYLPDTAFVIDPVVEGNTVTLGATSFAEERYDDGILATITFEAIAVKDSVVTLSDVILTDIYGNSTKPIVNGSTEITAPLFVREDVNQDGVVNIVDLTFIASNFGRTGKHPADVNGDGVVNIVDLALVAAAIGNNNNEAAPGRSDLRIATISREQVQSWLHEARQRNLSDPAFQRGILFLENLLKSLTPKQTALLPNYPNPFNPETWIPYQLASPSDVSITIYTSDGKIIRQLNIGHQPIGTHQQHWDGNNEQGEKVASGIYFYTLTAGEYTATRKMSICK